MFYTMHSPDCSYSYLALDIWLRTTYVIRWMDHVKSFIDNGEWMVGWMDGWMDRWMDGWMDA